MAGIRTLEQIYDAHADALFAFLMYVLGHESDVRDVMQDLFCRIAQKPDLISQAVHERPFLIRMAHSMALDSLRRRDARSRAHKSSGEHGETSTTPQTETSDAAAIDTELIKALKALPGDQSTVIHLKLKEEMTFEQIAEALDIPQNTAASRYRYGLEKLRTLLKPLYEEIK
jgi:RNA polymerase sigma-70 factor (ECF subfamily)